MMGMPNRSGTYDTFDAPSRVYTRGQRLRDAGLDVSDGLAGAIVEHHRVGVSLIIRLPSRREAVAGGQSVKRRSQPL